MAWLPRSLVQDLDAENQRAAVKTLADDVRRQRREASIVPAAVAEPESAQQQPAAPSFDLGAHVQQLAATWSDQPEQAQAQTTSNPVQDVLGRLTSIWDDNKPQQQPTPTPSGQPASMPSISAPFDDRPRLIPATITTGPRPGQTLQPGESVGSVTLGDGASAGTSAGGGEIDNSSRESFVRTAYPYMLEAAGGDRNLAELMLAKAISENGDVGKGGGFIGNNFSGLKWNGKGKYFEADTWEDYGQGRVNIRDKFQAFDTPQEGMAAFMSFLRDNPRYHPALEQYQKTGDADALFDGILAAGYATDGAWASKVRNIRDQQVRPALQQASAGARQSSMNAGAGWHPDASATPQAAGGSSSTSGLHPTVMAKWQAVIGHPPTDEEVAQLQQLGLA